jgi:uncharacterized delta-60 repeat protein
MATQGDGRILAVGYALGALVEYDFPVVRYNLDGTLNMTFDGDGIVTTQVSPNTDGAHDVVHQGAGKLVVSGVHDGAPVDTFAVARYNTDGSLDSTFGGGDGIVVAGPNGTAAAVTLQTDGKIVAVGGDGQNFGVSRYLGNPPLLAASTPALQHSTTITAAQAQPLLTEAIAR